MRLRALPYRAQDDKGGLVTALAALEACLQGAGRLPVNVKARRRPASEPTVHACGALARPPAATCRQ